MKRVALAKGLTADIEPYKLTIGAGIINIVLTENDYGNLITALRDACNEALMQDAPQPAPDR